MQRSLKELEQKLGLPFRRYELLEEAFTHSSWINEHRSSHADNERLEFLGDAVLELAVSEYLYRRHPDGSEGELTKRRASIVCEPSLVKFAKRLEFGDFLLLGKGEAQTGGRNRPALLADVFEAFVGALFLDRGLDAVRAFLEEHLFPFVDEDDGPQVTDYKTRLQEYAQQRNLGTPEYRIVAESGPAHDKQFISEVRMDGVCMGTGYGRSKKESEQQAARQALESLRDQ
ncbi:ribonuclease III [Paenibacillus thermoaerophilus]|uniref:Ribonuclease 3 n=1 Tax=Paenibacillus thermoaerophilus TaxID=1215385 RepID=A0ABW2V2D6_9BACL|nr:ribonuclease III [Paenibacillus thermoaerophilus]TMV19183.1 ribonuclease III [Paenibacillus thermoaerophilus]